MNPAAERRHRVVDEVSPGVYFAEGPRVNWIILAEGEELPLVDTDYLGNGDLVQRSLAEVTARTGAGRLSVILISHARADHIGNLTRFASRVDARRYSARSRGDRFLPGHGPVARFGQTEPVSPRT